ncbi:uncharacterized protein FIBRA_01214 [Fibroporia radiculosa]|uniref:FAD dependent oxidoreductase domain-containing protein n=1 Tax=Fibroporia radiculosa TaxID=599839 RepID=J4H0Z3_9APHY|nr:uncharacterized protein FIBRA_01214 [Fibroporia radiculosa]CCL99199.1 predicted protein [Fibroporia radiculosa]
MVTGIDQNSEILIIGAGCFGLSTAYHLLKRGFAHITVLDSASELPAPEAASTDMNKVVRSAYSDMFYAQLARDAIAAWKDAEEWGDIYHESGVLVLLDRTDSYSDQAYNNEISLGARIEPLKDAAALRSVFPPDVETCSFEERSGYLNRDGGWANSSQGIVRMLQKVTTLGGAVVPGKHVVRLLKEVGKTIGVECSDGSQYRANLVVLSAGAWTAAAFPDLHLGGMCKATGQSVGKIQLTPEEAAVYRDNPVYLDFNDFYAFPPNDQNIVKCAIHARGYTHMQDTSDGAVSAPIFVDSNGKQQSRVPKLALEELRESLRRAYPALGAKPWYTDSPDEDWVIGFHPTDPQVMLATAGSGHAYKFLPVIGRLVADAIQGILPADLVQKFALDRMRNDVTESRSGSNVRELDLQQMCTEADFVPS